ncbi:MAG: hypothetical protein WCJ07_07925 [Verrucomicrobiota bacterium]
MAEIYQVEIDHDEARRLCIALERLEKHTEKCSIEREALRKAALSLHVAYISGRRKEVERLYDNSPLTEQELEQIRKYESHPKGQPD